MGERRTEDSQMANAYALQGIASAAGRIGRKPDRHGTRGVSAAKPAIARAPPPTMPMGLFTQQTRLARYCERFFGVAWNLYLKEGRISSKLGEVVIFRRFPGGASRRSRGRDKKHSGRDGRSQGCVLRSSGSARQWVDSTSNNRTRGSGCSHRRPFRVLCVFERAYRCSLRAGRRCRG